MRKAFFVSRSFPWDRVIYPGSGPPFAAAYGWPVHGLDELETAACDVGIVESRIPASDLPRLARFLDAPGGPRFPLAFKVSDPEMPRSTDPGVRFLFERRDAPGVHFVSVYEPAGPLREALRGLSRSRVLRAPFPYDRAREVERPLETRARRVFLAGNRNRRLYPLRERMIRRHRWNPLARLVVDRLRHPGYPDLGRPPRHDVVGAKFVARAAESTHMFLDASAYGVELMKYLECAYAGCVPVGELPPSLEAVAGPYVVRTDGRLCDLRRAVRRPLDETRAASEGYRDALRAARDPRRLDADLDLRLREALGP